MKLFLKTKDYLVTGEEFELQHDAELDMLVTRPQPVDMDKYYPAKGYISHTDTAVTLIDRLYHWVKKYSLHKKLNLINKHAGANKTILDIGAGTGDFLVRAKRNGWVTTGVEPNEGARKRAEDKGIHIVASLSKIKNHTIDVITLWHVLEHLPNLDSEINTILSKLSESGTLILAVPNFKSYDAKHYKEFWAAYDTPRHRWHFSRNAIKKLFEKEGMKVIKVKPLIFDSYYVSLLSEKYKNGKALFVRAFLIGLWSNLEAWSTKEHSSLIYIIKKA